MNSEEYGIAISEYGGLDELERLQECQNDKVYDLCVKIIQDHFGEEDNDDQNIAPEISESGDAFKFASKGMTDFSQAAQNQFNFNLN